MSFINTPGKIRLLLKSPRSLIVLLLIYNNSSLAQHQHQHHDGVKEAVELVVKATEHPPEVSANDCVPPADRAFVNFDPKHLKDAKGFHGMLFFGAEETFYISHLPMFHPPHDYQAIMEVKLPPEAKASYQQKLKEKGGYFSFAPNGTFVLPEVVTKKMAIDGKLVQGHFERGGQELLDVKLEIVRVVFYKKISEADKKPEAEKYIIFGKGKEYFIAHEIFQRPNVDEIIPVTDAKLLPENLKQDIAQFGLSFIKDLKIDKDQMKFSPEDKPVLLPYKEFYRETGDLQ